MKTSSSVKLKDILESILQKKEYFTYRMSYCNGHLSYPYSEAFFELPQFTTFKERVTSEKFYLDDLLADAYHVVRLLLNEDQNETKNSDIREDQRVAFRCLTDFLKDYECHEKKLMILKENNKITETTVCEGLAVHLFSKLVPEESVILNKSMPEQSNACPCGCGALLDNFGDTGIGHQKIWHGFPDILVTNTAITIKLDNDNDVEEESGQCEPSPKRMKVASEDERELSYSTCSNHGSSIYDNKFIYQLIGQTVTNAFAQKTKDVHLIPSIGCTLEHLIIFLYDPELDILIRRSIHLDLFLQDNLVLEAIVELWFILNLHILGSSMSHKTVKEAGKFGFRKFVKDRGVLDYYKKVHLGVSQASIHGTEIDQSVHTLESRALLRLIC